MVEFLRERKPGDVATAPPVVAEIEYGVRRLPPDSRRRVLLERERDRILHVVPQLNWIPDVAASFGQIKAELEVAGSPIDDFDVLIAAFAYAHDCDVITANLVHFSRIQSVSSRHW